MYLAGVAASELGIWGDVVGVLDAEAWGTGWAILEVRWDGRDDSLMAETKSGYVAALTV